MSAPRASEPEKQLSATIGTCRAFKARSVSRTVSFEAHCVRRFGWASTGSQKPLSASSSSQR